MNKKLKTLEREVAADLAHSLIASPEDWRWRDGNFDLVIGPGGICMSARYFNIYSPTRVGFGFWNRRRIRRAFKRWKSVAGNALADSERRRALMQLRQCLSTPLRAVA